MTIPDLAADPALLQRLIDEGETLFVERKEKDPKDGLGETVASFANMLGGWLLVGVTDDGRVVGYDPPGRVDPQDYIRQLLGHQVDPLPPFVATTVPHPDGAVGVVRVFESADLPHVTSKGVIWRRNPGGKERVKEARDIIEMSRRGEGARYRAEVERLYRLPLIEDALQSPESVPGDNPRFPEESTTPVMEWIVRASPYTVTGAFTDLALSQTVPDLAHDAVRSLLAADGPLPERIDTVPQARGLECHGMKPSAGTQPLITAAIDAGGVVAVRRAYRQPDFGVHMAILEDELTSLIQAAVALVAGLDGYGRAAVGLEVRGVEELQLRMPGGADGGIVEARSLTDGGLRVGGDLAIPVADGDDVRLAQQWIRELGRTAGIHMWEPGE